MIIDNNISDCVAIFVLLTDSDSISFYVLIKIPCTYVQGWLRVSEIIQKRKCLKVCNRNNVIVEKKGECTHTNDEKQQGLHKTQQGNTSGFDRYQFKILSHVAK